MRVDVRGFCFLSLSFLIIHNVALLSIYLGLDPPLKESKAGTRNSTSFSSWLFDRTEA